MPPPQPPAAAAAAKQAKSAPLPKYIRARFPGARKWIYLETSARGLLPRTGRDAAMRYYDAQMMDGTDQAAMFDALDRVRGKFATLVGTKKDDVAVVKNVSEGLNAVVASFPWKKGDNGVICREIEHPNGTYALYNMRDRYGVEARIVRPTADKATPVAAITRAIDRRTRIVIVSSVTFTTGARTELAALGRVCRERNVFLMVDGAQSVGALRLDVNEDLVDGLTAGSSKYLCGPYGMGFLHVRRELADRMQPSWLARYGVDLAGMHEAEQGGPRYRLMPGARRFDLGSYNYAAANALDASLDIILGAGIRNIEHHVLGLAARLTAGLRELGLPVMSGSVPEHASHIVIVGESRPTAGTSSRLNSLYDHLSRNRVRLSVRQGRLRFSCHLYNTRDDIEQVLALVRAWRRG